MPFALKAPSFCDPEGKFLASFASKDFLQKVRLQFKDNCELRLTVIYVLCYSFSEFYSTASVAPQV